MNKFNTTLFPKKNNLIEKTNNKYIKIYTGIGIFITLMISVLTVNVVISSSLKDLSSDINLAGRQRMLSQRTAKLISNIDSSSRNSDANKIATYQKELNVTYKLFDDTLKGFTDGGDTIGADLITTVTIKKVSNPLLTSHLDKANNIWSQIKNNVLKVAKSNPASIDQNLLRTTVSQVDEYNLQLLAIMNLLTQGLEVESTDKASLLQNIQGITLLLTLINFFWLIKSALGTLRSADSKLVEYSKNLETNYSTLEKSNEALATAQNKLNGTNKDLQVAYDSLQTYSEEANERVNELAKLSKDLNLLKEESDTIFNSVDHGLFLIDKNFQIGRRISSAMQTIFETDHFSEMSLLDLLRPLITEKEIRTLESYLQLQFNPKTSVKQLDKYNPLKKIQISLKWDGKAFKQKYLGFSFERIVSESEIISVMVTVTNLTENVILENQLKQANEVQERKTGIILEIMNTDRSELEIFLAQTTKALDEINSTLRDENITDETEDDKNNKQFNGKELVEVIFRIVHNIKGNASMLRLQSIVSTAHQVEEKMATLRGKPKVTGDEFLSALLDLSLMREQINDYEEVMYSIMKDFTAPRNSTPTPKVEHTPAAQLTSNLLSFTEDLSNKMSKKVYLNSNLNDLHIDDERLSEVKDIFIQLIRNSLVHGIETAATRSSASKWESGSIYLSHHLDTSNDNTCHVFSYRDDGAGLDTASILATGISKGFVNANEAALMSESQIIALIFKPGFSTQDTPNEHAGRGTGMDLIRDRIVNELGGKLRMKSKKGQYLELTWMIPFQKAPSLISLPA